MGASKIFKIRGIKVYMKKKVAILFGGNSSEYEVSCLSAAGIAKNIDKEKFDFVMVGISQKGDWLLTNAGIEEIANGTWHKDVKNLDVTLSLNHKYPGVYVLDAAKNNFIKVDCIFPIIHGKTGEDGSIQGVMQLSGIPYVGCGIQSSVTGFDKTLTKKIVEELGVLQAKSLTIYADELIDDNHLARINSFFDNKYPLFVKPAREGSSIGISKVNKFDELKTAINEGFLYDTKLLIEEGIEGREIEIAVLGNKEIKLSKVGEIIANDNFYSYEAKYKSNKSKTSILTELPEEIYKKIKNSAMIIYKRLECKDLARVDFFLKENGDVVFNEINTMPGFTPISMYPKLWESCGIKYKELISKLIENAIAGNR